MALSYIRLDEISGRNALACLVAVSAALTAGFACLMLVSMFLAFILTLFTDVHRQRGQFWKVGRFLVGKLLQCATYCEQLTYTFGTGSHVLVALSKQIEAVIETDLPFLNTVRRRTDQACIGRASMVMLMIHFRSLSLIHNDSSSQCYTSKQNFSSIHGGPQVVIVKILV